MDKLLPCPFCGSAAKICEDEEGYFCVACMGECFSCTEPHGEPEHAADTWNQRTPDPALLALATFAAEIVKGIWREGSGFDSDDDGWFDELGRLHGITGDHDPELAPGIADAIAALLAPDGAGEVAP